MRDAQLQASDREIANLQKLMATLVDELTSE